uniref:Uncharacterized protein n=1 Tax=Tetranychus urticae TaxID=32264 RepID=T1JTX7_TETUR
MHIVSSHFEYVTLATYFRPIVGATYLWLVIRTPCLSPLYIKMSIMQELLEVKLIIGALGDIPQPERRNINRFHNRVERMVQDLDDVEVDLDEIPYEPAPSPVSIPSLSSSSSLPSLASIDSILSTVGANSRIENTCARIQKVCNRNANNSAANGQEINSVVDILGQIENRQHAQHLRVVEFLAEINVSLNDTITQEGKTTRNALQTFDRANNYFINEINDWLGTTIVKNLQKIGSLILVTLQKQLESIKT